MLVLIGPAASAERTALLHTLSSHAQVEVVTKRSVFRKRVASRRYDVVVLWSRDAQGIPNEPLLLYCLARAPECSVISILSAPETRSSGGVANMNRRLQYYPLPQHPTKTHMKRLARFVGTIGESGTEGDHADSRSSRSARATS